MAKKCWIERNKRKERTVKKYAKLRHQLKDEKDYVGLSMLPRDASPTRVVNRCEVTGTSPRLPASLPPLAHHVP